MMQKAQAQQAERREYGLSAEAEDVEPEVRACLFGLIEKVVVDADPTGATEASGEMWRRLLERRSKVIENK